ncbi:MAG: AIPR family protein [Ignavibacteria bacterium]|nr:AIPR family protein [Ignavibacteria bacterium]
MHFYDKIKDQVATITPKYNYPNDGTAFGHFIIKECFNKIVDFDFDGQDFDEFITSHIVDGSNDNGNDAIFVNKSQKRILVFQFKYSQNSSLLNTNEVLKNKKFIDWILRLSTDNLSPNSKLRRVIDNEISEILTDEALKNNEYTIAFYYVDRTFPTHNVTDIEALFNNYRDKGVNFDIKYYDYEKLNDLYDDVEIPKNNVELKIVHNEYFVKEYKYFDTEDTDLKTIVCSIQANSLKKLVKEQNELLFALNVRYFKGENEINSKIKQEYSKGSKSNFWILNNGINAICESFDLESDILKISNLQIVNGGQTTKTLTITVNDLPDEVHILMRLTKISSTTKVSKISKEIATSSNNQNAIGQRDLHSGDRLQRTIFKKLDDVDIFYDKKDGEWTTIANKVKFKNPFGRNPIYFKINNTDLGKSYLSFSYKFPFHQKGVINLSIQRNITATFFNQEVNEENQFYKLLFAYRVTEKLNLLKWENESKFEILQSSCINDVLISLSALYFLQEKLLRLKEAREIKDLINQMDFINYLNPTDRYSLTLDENFITFMMRVIRGLQQTLNILKMAKELNNETWIPKDTNNWLKKDGTYKQIIGQVTTYLVQNP